MRNVIVAITATTLLIGGCATGVTIPSDGDCYHAYMDGMSRQYDGSVSTKYGTTYATTKCSGSYCSTRVSDNPGASLGSSLASVVEVIWRAKRVKACEEMKSGTNNNGE
jgi:hypothetical protein